MTKNNNSAGVGFEKQLWESANILRGNIDASEYKHVVRGLIFLKYISDKFESRYQELVAEGDGFEEDLDGYTRKGIFFVPPSARWSTIAAKAHVPSIGKVINEALIQITKELTAMLRKSRTVDWQKKEQARAEMRSMVKRLLKKYKYPPEGQEEALNIVIAQCEVWTDEGVA